MAAQRVSSPVGISSDADQGGNLDSGYAHRTRDPAVLFPS
jgi:hypothetical protein